MFSPIFSVGYKVLLLFVKAYVGVCVLILFLLSLVIRGKSAT